MRRLLLASLFVAGSTLASAPALAKPPVAAAKEPAKPQAADALFKEGRAAMGDRDYEKACAKFRESEALDPAVGTLFNLADCEEKRGKLATAHTLFLEVLRKLAPADERHPIAKKRAEELEGKVGKLTLRLGEGAPEGSTLRLDDKPVKAEDLGRVISVDPGDHQIEAWAPGRASKKQEISVSEGESREVALAPMAEGETEGSVSSRDARFAGGIIATALGGSALLAGIITGGLTIAKKSEVDQNCPNKACNPTGLAAVDAGKSLGNASVATFVIGGLATATGVILILTSGGGSSEKTSFLRGLDVKVGPTGAGLSLTRRF